jgi:two-component system, OmpR family, response regulator
MADKKILIVEDDATLNGILQYNLKNEGYTVFSVSDGAQALDSAKNNQPDLILLDVMLPTMNGFEVCRILRQSSDVPILILTAKDDEIDKVVGLDLGADDYITKPFKMRELLARVRALLRRSGITASHNHTPSETIIKFNDLEIDTLRHKASLKGNILELTPKEFDLLTFLAQNKGIVFNREQLLEKVWGYDYPGDTRTVDVHIRWLRQKIENDPDKPSTLITIRGIGYRFAD